MNYEKLGICMTVIVVGCMLGFSTVASGEFDLNLTQGVEISPEITQSEDRLDNAYYNWCYTMKIECK